MKLLKILPAVLTAIFLTVFNCNGKYGEQHDSIAGKSVIEHRSDSLSARLEKIYDLKNTDSLDAFFRQCNVSERRSGRKSIKLSDTVRSIYAIYRCIYKPFNLFALGWWEPGMHWNSHCKYVLIQNKVKFSIAVTDPVDGKRRLYKDSVINFKPKVNLRKTKVLYLNPEYKKALNKFLGKESTRLGEGNIMNPSRPKGESENRYNFLRPFIPIVHGHWGGYWNLETAPFVGMIKFNHSLNFATVYFRVGYQGGEAFVFKFLGAWILLFTRSTWIE